MHENKLKIWTVFKYPTDYPNKYVARLFVGVEPTDSIIIADDIETIREMMIIDLGLTRLATFPQPPGDAKIVETWL